MHSNLEPAIVHDPIPQKISVFKICHPGLCVGPSWYVIDVPAGTVIARRYSWPEALETGAHYLRAALNAEAAA